MSELYRTIAHNCKHRKEVAIVGLLCKRQCNGWDLKPCKKETCPVLKEVWEITKIIDLTTAHLANDSQ